MPLVVEVFDLVCSYLLTRTIYLCFLFIRNSCPKG